MDAHVTPAALASPDNDSDPVLPAGSWLGAHGKILSRNDRIPISLSEEDLGALCRTLEKAMSCLGEIEPGLADRLTYAEHLFLLQEYASPLQTQKRDGELSVSREHLHTLHWAFRTVAGHVGNDRFLLRCLIRIRKATSDAVKHHDDDAPAFPA